MSEKTVVVDNGSGTLYAGFAEEDDPLALIPNAVGKNKASENKRVNFMNFSDPDNYKSFVNDIKNGEYKLHYPMDKGMVTDWDAMEAVWDYAFTKSLSVEPAEYNLLITEAIKTPKPNREKMAQLLFERFGFPAVCVYDSAILPLYSAGLTTGVVLDCGDGVVQTAPVWGGYPISDAMDRADFGGRDVTLLLSRILREKGAEPKPLEVVKLIKESICFVPGKGGHEAESDEHSSTFQLPDGESIQVGKEARSCPELLFIPSIVEERGDKGGVHEMLYKSIMKTDMDIRKDLYGHILVSGGSTLFPGFVDRLTDEIGGLLPQKAKLTIRASPDRQYATWKGASVLASLSSFNQLLISKAEFEEVGPSIMHKTK